jgi:primosomal protein N' (replication factor Y)
VGLPVRGTFTYRVPPEAEVAVGARVLVPFGGRGVTGIVVALDPPGAPELASLKGVRAVLDGALDRELVELLLWVAQYYEIPPGEMLRAAVPAGLDVAEAAWLTLTERGREVATGAAAVGALPPAAVKLLGALAAGGRMKRGEAVKAGGRAGAAALAALTAAGLVADEAERREARVKARTVRWVRRLRAPAPDELARAPRGRAILEALERAGGELEQSALGPGAAAALAKLAAAGLTESFEREELRDPFATGEPDVELAHAPRDAPPPTAGQARALAALGEAIAAREFRGFLLHGVTGSGKTEVYLQAIAEVLARGRTAIVLVPEIALTPQLAARFRARFPTEVAVLHSGLGPGERYDEWRRLSDGRARIALGARSAVFAPLRDLGAVVVDEEHDSSFKQEEHPRYHARDVALVRAQRAGALCLLGSATPSLESHLGARTGRLTLLELPERPTARPMPSTEIIDLKRYRTGEDALSAPLAAALTETFAAGEQAILFLNRRGFAPSAICTSCGEVVRCRDCSVSLTYHRAEHSLICHYCGFQAEFHAECAVCGGGVQTVGLGTEKVEELLAARFPAARVGRLDRDTARGQGLRKVLAAFRERRLDVVVGTQLVTKGHDFPGVTLVGVLNADVGLSVPDFRAGERTLQLLTQVAGRAGRGDRPGRVIIQTFNPEHPAIVCARQHDFAAFAERELELREELDFPPHGRLIALRIDGPDGPEVCRVAARLGTRAARLLETGAAAAGVSVLGPAEAPLARLRGRTRWHLYVKGRDRAAIRTFARRLVDGETDLGSVRLSLDVDPVNAL